MGRKWHTKIWLGILWGTRVVLSLHQGMLFPDSSQCTIFCNSALQRSLYIFSQSEIFSNAHTCSTKCRDHGLLASHEGLCAILECWCKTSKESGNWKKHCPCMASAQWQRPKTSTCYVSCLNSPAQSLLHQHAGHLAAEAMLTSTRIVSGDDKTSQGIYHLPAWWGGWHGSPARRKSLIFHSLICLQQKKCIISSIWHVRIYLTEDFTLLHIFR